MEQKIKRREEKARVKLFLVIFVSFLVLGSSNGYVALEDGEYDGCGGMFDKPLPYFGCGIGWFL